MLITNSRIGYNGRLGNQLFQFASLYGIAKECGKDIVIPRENLQEMNQCFSNGEVKSVKLNLIDIFPKLEKYIDSFEHEFSFRRVQEKSFEYDADLVGLCKNQSNIDINGWFQSPLYFNKYYDELLDILSFEKEILENRTDKPLVSIHVRRGDYLALPDNHPVCDQEYYEAAISHFGDCYFVVFSDDTEWCKNAFCGQKFLFSENCSEGEDLQKISLCDHHIIANSTFSWWGAYLNKNKNKQIIAPKSWFGVNYSNNNTEEILSIATKII